MTDTNRVTLSYAKETTYGTAPTGSGAYQNTRYTGESLHQATSTITSAEIRDDRQVSDVIRSNVSVAGDISFELSYSFEELLIAAVMSDQAGETFTAEVSWAGVDLATDISGGAGLHKFVQDGTGNFSSFTAGQWIHTKLFVNSENNGYFKIKTISSNDMTIYGVLVTEGANTSATMDQGGQCFNGTKQRSYSIQRIHNDISAATSGRSEVFTGCMFDGLTINVSTESVVTGSLTIIGAKEASNNTELGTNPVAATVVDVMNCVDNVLKMMEGTDYASTPVTAFSAALANNLRARLQVASLGAVGIGSGTCNVTGTFQKYYASATLMDKALNFTDTAIAIVFEDTDGNAYCFEFPKVVFTTGQRVAGGQNQDLIADMSWEAYMHDTELVTIRISKWAA